MSTSSDQRLIPRQRGADRAVGLHRAESPPVSLWRRLAVRYLLGMAEAAGVATVGAVTYAVLVWVLR